MVWIILWRDRVLEWDLCDSLDILSFNFRIWNAGLELVRWLEHKEIKFVKRNLVKSNDKMCKWDNQKHWWDRFIMPKQGTVEANSETRWSGSLFALKSCIRDIDVCSFSNNCTKDWVDVGLKPSCAVVGVHRSPKWPMTWWLTCPHIIFRVDCMWASHQVMQCSEV